MATFLNSIKRNIKTRLRKQPAQVEFAWRVVEEGALKGASAYVLAGRSWGNDVVSGRYEPEFFSILQEQANGGGCFYDIGGHVGLFSLAWLKMGGDFVETFEPLPSNAALIKEVLQRNQMQGKFQIHELAAGDFSAEGTLVEHKFDSSRGQIAELDNINLAGRSLNEKQQAHKIQVARLDTLFEKSMLQPPTLMKIDVEGAEHNVLQGAIQFIKQFKPHILMEVHNTNSALLVSTMLTSMGYDLKMLGSKGAKQSLPLCQWIPKQ